MLFNGDKICLWLLFIVAITTGSPVTGTDASPDQLDNSLIGNSTLLSAVNASTSTELVPDDTSENVTEEETMPTLNGLWKLTEPPVHDCMRDVDESEPEFQRYVCTGSWITSLIGTTFLLTMIFFAVVKNISAWGFMNLVDIRRVNVSFPQRPELIVLLCSTIPMTFTTVARPLFLPYPPLYDVFISELRFMQARQFFDLFSRTASVYHLVYWAYRMPIIRWLWRNYLRFQAFRAVWTKEHIIEVLRDTFAPEKDDKFRQMFQNSPEKMYYYAQFLQSGMPMQYFQYLTKPPGNRSPSMSNAGLEGLIGPGSGRQHREGEDILPRMNLANIMSASMEDSSSPKSQVPYSSFIGVGGASPSKSATLMPPGAPGSGSGSHGVSRNTSFRGSGRPSPNLSGGSGATPDNAGPNFGQHLMPEDAIASFMMMERQGGLLTPEMRSQAGGLLASQDFVFPPLGPFPSIDAIDKEEKKRRREEIRAKPPSKEFLYICKHLIPGIIYILSFFATLPSIFGFDMYQYESRITTAYFYYDMVFIVILPMAAIIAAFYHGALAKTQLNGGTKMRFRLRCYYVNFIILNMPMLFLMITATAYRITLSREVESEKYGTGIIIAMTAYHAQFVLKSTVYTTGCNCICCSTSCLSRHPCLNKCLVRMTTPRNPPATLPTPKKEGEEEEDGGEGQMKEIEAEDGVEVFVMPPVDAYPQGTEIPVSPTIHESE